VPNKEQGVQGPTDKRGGRFEAGKLLKKKEGTEEKRKRDRTSAMARGVCVRGGGNGVWCR